MSAMELEAGLARMLEEALDNPARREPLLRAFQDAVADAPDAAGELWELYSDLATELEFYVPDPDRRVAHRSYFGDERAEALIRPVLAAAARLRAREL